MAIAFREVDAKRFGSDGIAIMCMATRDGVELDDETSIDVSIILNIHRESVFIRRAWLSLAAALHVAELRGIGSEVVVVLDQTDDDTRNEVARFDDTHCRSLKVIEVDRGSLGLSRNDGIAASRGHLILTADADDLVSTNYIADMVVAGTSAGPNVIHFPEYVLSFGAMYEVYILRSLCDATPLAFVEMYPFVSRLCCHRRVFDQILFADLRLSSCYAYEDWHFSAECVAHHYDLRVVPEIVLFYRQRQRSLLRQANDKSIRQIPPSKLFEPKIYTAIGAEAYATTSKLVHSNARAAPATREFMQHPAFIEFMRSANAIEPELSAARYQSCGLVTNSSRPLTVGIAYFEICNRISGCCFDDILLFPFIAHGDADKYMINLLDRLYKENPLHDVLIICGEKLEMPSGDWRVPPNVTVIDLATFHETLSLQERALIALKLIQSCGATARIHLRQSIFADAFLTLYGPALQKHRAIYYRFADREWIEHGHPVVHASSLPAICDNLSYISAVICDCYRTLERDRDRIGLAASKWKLLRAPVDVPTAIVRYESSPRAKRILWASRLEPEKRVSLLPIVARRLQSTIPEATINFFGGDLFVDGLGPPNCSLSNIHDLGCRDDLELRSLADFSVCIYTSWSDGIPSVLLEAMSVDVPVVAPHVGGISEVVIDGETGVLLSSIVDDEAMAEAYVAAIGALMSDPTHAAGLALRAKRLLRKRHSRSAYGSNVSRLLFDKKVCEGKNSV